jgi:hypothetical protein
MKTNDIKKGQRIQLNNGWSGTMFDSKKGNIRTAEIEGDFKEIGSVYAHDISRAQDDQGVWHTVELTDSQLKLKSKLRAMGW